MIKAILPSKGQITLPKSIRQALGVDTGGKIAFALRGGEVVVTRVGAEHEEPAIGTFLGLLEADIGLAGMSGPCRRIWPRLCWRTSTSKVKWRSDAAAWLDAAVS